MFRYVEAAILVQAAHQTAITIRAANRRKYLQLRTETMFRRNAMPPSACDQTHAPPMDDDITPYGL